MSDFKYPKFLFKIINNGKIKHDEPKTYWIIRFSNTKQLLIITQLFSERNHIENNTTILSKNYYKYN